MDLKGSSPGRHLFLKMGGGKPLKFEDIEDGQHIKIKAYSTKIKDYEIMYMTDDLIGLNYIYYDRHRFFREKRE